MILKVTPFAQFKPTQRSVYMLWLSKLALAHVWLYRLDRGDSAGRESESVYGEKMAPARKVTLPSQKGYPARQVILLAEPTFLLFM